MPRVKQLKRTRAHHFLKEWRDHRGLTQEKMAELVKLSRPNYGRIESGKVPYNQDFLELAAAALQCTPADILVRDPKDGTALWTIYDRLRKIDPEVRARILAVVDVMAKTAS